MKAREITSVIEEFAPLSFQEKWDNSGYCIGSPDQEVHSALLGLDCTPELIDEAVASGADMVITHHPIIFHPLKRLNSASPVERCVERAIRRGIALYACHTNLDSAPEGMSFRLGQQLGLQNMTLLEPSEKGDGVGFGVVGELSEPQPLMAYLKWVQQRLSVRTVRYSDPATERVQRVAICTGAGASMIGLARRRGAELYLTADLKYNDFMTPDKALTVADIGHFESEFCAIELLFDILSKKLLTFAVLRSEASRNPINYLF